MAVWGTLPLAAQRTAAMMDFPILGGELSNSAATSAADIEAVMPRMRALGLNTVLVPAYWELMEPEEGRFDFTLIDLLAVGGQRCGRRIHDLYGETTIQSETIG